MATESWAIVLVLLGSLVSSFTPILLKKALQKKFFPLINFIINKYLLGAIFAFGIGILAYIIALRNGELSVIYPLTSLSYVWVSLYSVRFLGEKMSKFKWVGIALIVVGVVLIGSEGFWFTRK